MSTSIILLDKNFSANDVDILYLNLVSYSAPTPPAPFGIRHMVLIFFKIPDSLFLSILLSFSFFALATSSLLAFLGHGQKLVQSNNSEKHTNKYYLSVLPVRVSPVFKAMVSLPRSMARSLLALPRSFQGYHDHARLCKG